MKHLNFFAKAALGAVFAVCFCSCSFDANISISEITQNKEIIMLPSSEKLYLNTIKMIYGKTVDMVKIRMIGYKEQTIELPSGGSYSFYEDSLVVTTANRHKLKILYWGNRSNNSEK